jgi:hypothetical protein
MRQEVYQREKREKRHFRAIYDKLKAVRDLQLAEQPGECNASACVDFGPPPPKPSSDPGNAAVQERYDQYWDAIDARNLVMQPVAHCNDVEFPTTQELCTPHDDIVFCLMGYLDIDYFADGNKKMSQRILKARALIPKARAYIAQADQAKSDNPSEGERHSDVEVAKRLLEQVNVWWLANEEAANQPNDKSGQSSTTRVQDVSFSDVDVDYVKWLLEQDPNVWYPSSEEAENHPLYDGGDRFPIEKLLRNAWCALHVKKKIQVMGGAQSLFRCEYNRAEQRCTRRKTPECSGCDDELKKVFDRRAKRVDVGETLMGLRTRLSKNLSRTAHTLRGAAHTAIVGLSNVPAYTQAVIDASSDAARRTKEFYAKTRSLGPGSKER